MELQFSPQLVEYLRMSACESKKLEETMESIVPDSSPDMDRILCGSAVVFVRNKQCYSGGASVSGGIYVKILYAAEGEKNPRCLENYIPFQWNIDLPEVTENAKIKILTQVQNVDARMVNSRKVSVRVNLWRKLWSYESCEQKEYRMEQAPESLQVKEEEYEVQLPVEMAECTFQMTEDLRLPSSKPMTGELLQFLPRIEVLEKRIAADKAVFKGLVHLQMVYGTDEGIASHETELPFAQYCQLEHVYEEDDLDVSLLLTGCEARKSMQTDGTALSVDLSLLGQCIIKQKKKIQMYEDAYCIGGTFEPVWETCVLDSALDSKKTSHTIRESKQTDVSEVVSAWVCEDLPGLNRDGEQMNVAQPLSICLLYLDKEKRCQYVCFRTELHDQIKLADGAKCFASLRIENNVSAIAAGGGIEMRLPLMLELDCYAPGEFRTLCGGTINTQEQGKRRPSVIVRRTGRGEPLWDIAKKNGTTVDKIRRANGITSDTTEAGMLLIPT